MAYRFLLTIVALLVGTTVSAKDIWDDVEHGYADSSGVKIHYATMGEGPLVVMIHGFPDFWYSWRDQMAGLADNYQVVAIDQRGYNLSGQPEGQENYAMSYLVADVAAVIKHLGRDKAVIVGHDWGGAVAWSFTFAMPQMVDRLIILNLPHPNGMSKVAATNAAARANTEYARTFRNGQASDPNIFFGGPMTAQSISGWVSDPEARKHYIEAFEQSDFDAMLAYYKMNYPSPPPEGTPIPQTPMIDKQVLIFHGLKDTALHSDGLNNTWDWISQDVTVVSAPNAGHFVQQDASHLVTSTMKWWLLAREPE
ncbi:MAG: alpha/beta hydrolase [Proteobacteria bacterium]|nr:alpha/beta hydrolase [Pseudomonadota bacterium]